MNPFKGVSGGLCKRKSKPAMVEVKQELVIKEEPNGGDNVMNIPRPSVDGRYRANYDRPFDFDYDFDVLKDEIKEEEGKTVKEKNERAHRKQSNGSNAVNNDDNGEPMGNAIDDQPPKPVDSERKRSGSSRRQNKRTVPGNQAAKKQKQKKHKCHVCNHLTIEKSNLKVHLRIHTGEKPFQCDVCSKSFAQKNNLNRHKKTHGPKLQFRCSKCYKRFERESDKIDHERLCDPQQFGCDICGYHTVAKSNLTLHMRIHTGEKPFECSICFKSFATNSDLQRHSMIHINGPPNACSKCGRRFPTPDDKQSHEARCQRSVLACDQCHYKTVHKDSLKRHMQSMHGAKRSIECETHTGEKPFQCDVCSKYFKQKSHLNSHKKTHGQFRCSKCNQGFEQESAKIDHERSCNPLTFECDICGYHSVVKSNLIIHMRIHSADKPYVCSICFKSFITNDHLQRHSMAHKDELPNACAKCGRRFATPDDKQSHETRCQRSVSACNQCRYKSVHKRSLKWHMQSMHGAKRSIECEICSKQFVKWMDLNRHLSSAHSDQFPFECSKCFGGYATEDAKELHEDICGHRRYQCHLCKEHRRNIDELNIHMRKDHTGERIQCEVCAASFNSKSNADRHMKTVHRLKKKRN